MNILNLILVITMYPVVFIFYFCLKNEGHEPRKGIYYGVSLNKEQAKDEALAEITNTYQKQMKGFLWISLLMPWPILFFPWFSLSISYWCIWFFVVCVIFFIPFGIANKKLKELKLEKGWTTGVEPPRFTEIKEAARIRRVKWYHFLAPILISVASLVWTLIRPRDGREALLLIIVVTFGSMTLLFWGLAVWMDKEKTAIVSTDSNVNVNYSRACKNMWKNFWVAMTWVNVLCLVGMLFFLTQEQDFSIIFWLFLGLYLIATLILPIWVWKKNRSIEKRYEDKMDIRVEDSDAHWIWGMFYCNPKDKHTMVNKRVGLGTTVNLATPVGKGTLVLLIVTLLSLPAMCIWVTMEEFTPIHMRVEDNTLVVRHLREKFHIALEDVQETVLLTQLPKMSRNHGNSLDNLLEGSYRVKEDSASCEVLLNPQNGIFIRVETEDEIYLFSGFDDAETRQVYEAMLK